MIMSDEYIKRTDALKAIEWTWAGKAAFDNLKAIPAADVVEVVRCGECEHSIMHKSPYNYEKVLACKDPHGVTIRAVKPMHFCSYGKKREVRTDERFY